MPPRQQPRSRHIYRSKITSLREVNKPISKVAIQPQIDSGDDLSMNRCSSLLDLLKCAAPVFFSCFILLAISNPSHGQSVSQLIDELSGDRPLIEGELFNIQLPESGGDRHVEILLKTAESVTHPVLLFIGVTTFEQASVYARRQTCASLRLRPLRKFR